MNPIEPQSIDVGYSRDSNANLVPARFPDIAKNFVVHGTKVYIQADFSLKDIG
jgi:hypothetical protein